jgi:hypothetical protein
VPGIPRFESPGLRTRGAQRAGTNAWPENEIDQYIEDRIAARDAEPTAA